MRLFLSIVIAGGLLYFGGAADYLRIVPAAWQDAREMLDRAAASIR